MLLASEIELFLTDNGAYDVGFARIEDGPPGLSYAISVVVPLSDAVLDEIDDGPTHTYFHHYRTVNALIDRILLQTGILLQKNGYRYMPVPASQTIHYGPGPRSHRGLYSHKKAAVLAGLGTIGKSALFLHRKLGPRVRLGTLFTDCPLPVRGGIMPYRCEHCSACVDACPAKAIRGESWQPGLEREALVDAHACNDYMRAHFMGIGRGAVCGICVKICPMGRAR
jgi:epoxyqueuosine reductase QueG